MSEPISLQIRLDLAISLLREAAGRECEMCEAGDDEPLWQPGDDLNELWHGTGEDIGQCESSTMQDAIRAGVIEVPVYQRAPCDKDHPDWYGPSCPECDEAAISKAEPEEGK